MGVDLAEVVVAVGGVVGDDLGGLVLGQDACGSYGFLRQFDGCENLCSWGEFWDISSPPQHYSNFLKNIFPYA